MDNTSEKKKKFSSISNSLIIIKSFFWGNKNKQILSISFLVVFLFSIIVYFIYSNFYLTSNTKINDAGYFSSIDETAEILLLIGENNIKQGNYNEALFGSDSVYFLPNEIKGTSIIFSGLNDLTTDSKLKETLSAKTANYWIGVCYYKLAELTDSAEEKYNNYSLAIEYLQKEKTDSEIFNSFKESQTGDAFLQLGQPEKALKYYKKALDLDNHIIRVEVLYKAAETAKMLENNNLAIDYYNEIREKFPKSEYAIQVNKKIAELSAKNY